jgi:hypothetical protein
MRLTIDYQSDIQKDRHIIKFNEIDNKMEIKTEKNKRIINKMNKGNNKVNKNQISVNNEQEKPDMTTTNLFQNSLLEPTKKNKIKKKEFLAAKFVD